MIVANLPPQITLECEGNRSGFLRGSQAFSLTIYIDVASRRFVTAGKDQFDWPREGTINSITPQKIVLWNITEKFHPFLHSWAEIYIGSYRYLGGIRYAGRAMIDEKYTGNCVTRPGVPTSLRKLLKNA